MTAARIGRGATVTPPAPQHKAESLTARGLPGTAWTGAQEGEATFISILKVRVNTLSF